MKRIFTTIIAAMLVCALLCAGYAEVKYEGGKVIYDYDVAEVSDVKLDGEYKNTVYGKGQATITQKLADGEHVLTIGGVDTKFKVSTAESYDIVIPAGASSVEATIKVGHNYNIIYTGKTIKSCKTGNKKAATVTKAGVVTPVAYGAANITVNATDKSKATVKLTVVDPAVPTDISFEAVEKYLPVKAKITLKPVLTAEKQPAKNSAVTWSTSNKKVATVDKNGVVTGKKAGTVTITATIPNGKKASVTFEVADPKVPVSMVIDQGSEAALSLSSKTMTLTVTQKNYLGNDVSSKLKWSTSNKKVAKISSKGVVTAVAAGTAKITVTNGSKMTATITITVTP